MISMGIAVALASLLLLIPLQSQAYVPPDQFTEGEPWPLPQNISYFNFNHTLNPKIFSFRTTYKCDVTDQAFLRYQKLMFSRPEKQRFKEEIAEVGDATLQSLTVIVTEPCPSGVPQQEMDECYSLNVPISGGNAVLTAPQVWGALRGLETFSQLLFHPDGDINVFKMRAANIRDCPRFPHRGVLLDTSRHFLPIDTLLANLDMMEQNKLNVFHWHIVDDQSFPFESKIFPNLSTYGAYTKRHIYTQEQVKSIVDYARLRGIRVVAEFDTPGHTQSWGKGHPDLVSDCYDKCGKKKEERTLIDPTKPWTWDFLLAFFKEVLQIFPDHHIHLGGDEAHFWMPTCWENNPLVRKFMTANGLGNDTKKLENYYFKNLLKIIERARPGTKTIVWQEVMDSDIEAPNAVAHVWRGNTDPEWKEEMATVTRNGHFALLSSCWYFDNLLGKPDHDYSCDPDDFEGSVTQKKLVLGGEAAMWGEMVDATNVLQRLWPRASAVAERLWSDPGKTKLFADSWPRLHEMRCRMVLRGYPAQPIYGPSFCPIP